MLLPGRRDARNAVYKVKRSRASRHENALNTAPVGHLRYFIAAFQVYARQDGKTVARATGFQ